MPTSDPNIIWPPTACLRFDLSFSGSASAWPARWLANITVPATGAGYLQLLEWATEHTPGPRLAWAVEGTRSHGAGLTRLLTSSGQAVIEAARPPRRNARPGGKSDPRDALLAARQALSAAHHAQPRGDGPREALRLLLVVRNTSALARTAAINTLKALILTAPDDIREQLRGRTIVDQLARIGRLRIKAGDTIRIAERKSDYEIRRCLKRSISRSLDRLMQRTLANENRPAESPLFPRYLALAV